MNERFNESHKDVNEPNVNFFLNFFKINFNSIKRNGRLRNVLQFIDKNQLSHRMNNLNALIFSKFSLTQKDVLNYILYNPEILYTNEFVDPRNILAYRTSINHIREVGRASGGPAMNTSRALDLNEQGYLSDIDDNLE